MAKRSMCVRSVWEWFPYAGNPAGVSGGGTARHAFPTSEIRSSARVRTGRIRLAVSQEMWRRDVPGWRSPPRPLMQRGRPLFWTSTPWLPARDGTHQGRCGMGARNVGPVASIRPRTIASSRPASTPYDGTVKNAPAMFMAT